MLSFLFGFAGSLLWCTGFLVAVPWPRCPTACGILAPWIEPMSLCTGRWFLNHCTTREILSCALIRKTNEKNFIVISSRTHQRATYRKRNILCTKKNRVWLSDKYTHKPKIFHSIKDTSQGRDYDIYKKFNQHQRKVS